MKNKPASIAFILLLLFIGGSVWLVFEYVSAEKQRDLDAWQARLNIMAESQQHTIEKWFAEQAGNINELANNPLLQLYVSQVTSTEEASSETSRGQLQHLKNLINATAEHARVFTPIENIKSNLQNKINDGIAIVNDKGVLLATRYFPVEDIAVGQAYNRALKNGSIYISNIYDAGANDEGERQPRLIMVAPVSSVQAMSSSDYRAAVIAVINPENSLYALLVKEWNNRF